LRLADVAGAMPLVEMLVLREGMHVVALDGVKDPAALRQAAQGIDGVEFVDPIADVTDLLGRYRTRAVWMIAISTLFMAALLAWRYGPRGAGLVLLPPLCAIVMTPALLALFGMPFTFFGAMALVMVLAMGLDFAVFCAEADGQRDPVTVLATLLATLTALLSFGLMAFSQAAGVRSFGAVMLVGMTLAFLLSPFAGRVRPKRSSHAS
jgi:predicted exporter